MKIRAIIALAALAALSGFGHFTEARFDSLSFLVGYAMATAVSYFFQRAAAADNGE